MTEDFLHYIWKFQKFCTSPLILEDGSELTVFQTGHHNYNSGPDFELARIKIGETEWWGNVEIHIKSSDWNLHKHQEDEAYKNVILHVVWENNQPISVNGKYLPTLVLKGKIEDDLVEKYENYLKSNIEILCQNYSEQFAEIKISSLKSKMLIERLEQKSHHISSILDAHQGNWETTAYITLAENFGFSVNKAPFRRLTKVLPLSILQKYLKNPVQREALLFGQAGFLENPKDEYAISLKNEHQYLAKKHNLSSPLNEVEWKFSKIRPANFPTIRIAQFGFVLEKLQHLFDKIIDFKDIESFSKLLTIEINGYWSNHYHFGKEQQKTCKKIGKPTLENILINTIAPILVTYGKQIDNEIFLENAIELLEKLKPENNSITKKYQGVFPSQKSAFDSQSVIHLYKNYCSKKKCLNCNLGISIFAK